MSYNTCADCSSVATRVLVGETGQDSRYCDTCARYQDDTGYQTEPLRYVAGWNMSSYSPDPDNLWITDDYSAAVAYLLDTVEHWWDGDYMGGDADTPEQREAIDGRYLTAHTDLHNPGTGPSFSTVVYDRNGYPYSFWIDVTDEPISEDY